MKKIASTEPARPVKAVLKASGSNIKQLPAPNVTELPNRQATSAMKPHRTIGSDKEQEPPVPLSADRATTTTTVTDDSTNDVTQNQDGEAHKSASEIYKALNTGDHDLHHANSPLSHDALEKKWTDDVKSVEVDCLTQMVTSLQATCARFLEVNKECVDAGLGINALHQQILKAQKNVIKKSLCLMSSLQPQVEQAVHSVVTTQNQMSAVWDVCESSMPVPTLDVEDEANESETEGQEAMDTDTNQTVTQVNILCG